MISFEGIFKLYHPCRQVIKLARDGNSIDECPLDIGHTEQTGASGGGRRLISFGQSPVILKFSETLSLARILRLFAHAAQRQNKKGTHQVWTHENHAIQLYSNEVIQEKVQYIHMNPVRSGIVNKPEDYIYSSAKNYIGDNGVLDVLLIDRIWKTYT